MSKVKANMERPWTLEILPYAGAITFGVALLLAIMIGVMIAYAFLGNP